MSAPQSYYVPVDAGEAEFTEKRSRFLGHVRRVETEAEARAFLDEMRKKYYDARHNCWCYVLHEGGVVRYGDDGEPQGTAGQPISQSDSRRKRDSMNRLHKRDNFQPLYCWLHPQGKFHSN